MRTILKPCPVGLFVSVLLLSSCATRPRPAGVVPPSERPADVTMNKDAGRGAHLFVMVRVEGGEALPFLVDTGSPMTILDKSLEPKLGKCLGTETLWNFGDKYEASVFAAPKLYFGSTPLITDSNALTSDLFAKLSSRTGRPIMGILGMDCLQHYCIQLDFKAGKMRFLDADHLKATKLGHAFALTFSSAGNTHSEWIRPCTPHCSLVGGEDADLFIDTGADGDGALEPGLFRREIREQRLHAPEDTTQDQEPNSIGLPQCVWNGATYTDLLVGNGAYSKEGKSGENSLGLRFLARHLVTFDFPHRILYLKRTSSGPLLTAEVVAAARAAGNSAFPLARKLMENGHLPGWSKEDRGTIKRVFHFRLDPDTVTFDAVKKGDSSTYHYEFTRASQASPWQLQKAWRTDQDDHTAEEYPIPWAPRKGDETTS
jgi:hypothetical protein